MSVGLGTAIGYLKIDSAGFAKGIQSAMSDMNELERGVETTSQKLQTVGSVFTNVGGALTAGFTAPIVGAAAASIKFGSDFDQQMSNVKAVTGATVEEFEAMRNAAISWGEKTKYTATEAGEALYYMGLAGWDSQESIEGLGPILNLAAAGNLELGRTSDIVTDALTAFGLTAKDTTDFTNVLAAAMSNSNTDVNMMGESFKYVAPVAGALNYDIRDVALALGLFANNGVKSSQAGTGLRQAFNALINPSSKAAALMDRYGVSLFNVDGSTKSFMTVMEDLRGTFGNVSLNAEEVSGFIEDLGLDLDSLDGEAAATEAVMEKFGHALPTTEMENLSALVKIFGVRALPGMLSVINASEDDFYGLSEKIYNANEAFVRFGGEIYTMEEALKMFGDRVYNDDSFEILGAAAGMADVQMDNLKGDWDKFTSALGTSQIIISDMAKGALRELVQKMTELVNWFNNLDEGQREQIIKWAMIVAAIGPVLIAIGKIISIIGSLITIFGKLKGTFTIIVTAVKHVKEAFILAKAGLTAFASQTSVLGTALAGITGPMIAIVALVTALVAAFVNLWNNNEEFRNRIIEIWEGIKAKFEEAGERIVEIFNALGFNFEDFQELMSAAIELLGELWDGFCELLAPGFIAAFEIIGDILEYFIDTFVGGLEVLSGIIKGFKDGDWSMFWQGLQSISEAKSKLIIGIMDSMAGAFWGVIQKIANWFGFDWNLTWDEAKQAVANWFNSVVGWLKGIVENVKDTFNKVWQIIKSIHDTIWNVIKTIWGNILDVIVGVLQKIITRIKSAWDDVVKTTSSYMQSVWNVIKNIWDIIKGFLQKIVSEIYTEIKNKWDDIKNFISVTLTAIQNVISTVWNAIKSFLSTVINEISKNLTNTWNSIKNTISTVVNTIKQVITDAFNAVKTNVTNATNAVQTTLVSVWNSIKSTISNTVNGIKTTIVNAFDSIKTSVINSVNSLKNTITNTFNSVKSTITGIFDGIKSAITSSMNGLQSSVSTIFNNIKSAMVNPMTAAKQEIVTALQNTYNSMLNVFKDIGEKFKDIGKKAIQGIINGIKNTASGLYESVYNALKGMVDKAKDALGIKSPSRAFRDQVGKWIPPGIAEGFVDAMPAAVRDIENSLNKGINDINADSENIELGLRINNFVEDYKQVFENLVIWFETMEERMSIAIESLTSYFEYLMYVKQTLGNDEFRTFVLNRGGNSRFANSTGLSNDMTNNSANKNGDVFIFQSPKPIDEVQAARMLKNTKRDLAEGF